MSSNTTTTSDKKTHAFQAEVKQVLDLMIHSLYSNKEIFLRELVSNASDACEKLRFKGLADDSLYEGDADMRIRVSIDSEAHAITIEDNGIGMTEQEVADNIGTIARSGTKRFLQSMASKEQEADTQDLIGQFGVGFYSAFIVADHITLETRTAGAAADQGVRWQSSGDGSYTLEPMDKATRGTRVILHLREEEKEFLEPFRLREIVKKFSDHIALPVQMLAPQEKTDEAPSEDADKQPEQPKQAEWENINAATAIWRCNKKDIKQEEYDDFYKTVAHDYESPLSVIHNRIEGKQAYSSLLFIPRRAPFDLWEPNRKHGIKLYVRKVFIMDDTEHMLPNYLRFMRGVIDSDDLPLNVSRELLQKNQQIEKISAATVKKILGQLERMAKNKAEDYSLFWSQFGKVLKEGVIEDQNNKERIAGLLRFASTHTDTDEQNVSLADYISRMQEGQDKIYYITAETFATAKSSPHLEVFRRKGIEVLLLSDRVDEWLSNHLNEFDGKPLSSVAKGNIEDLLDKESEEKRKQAEDGMETLPERIKNILNDAVSEVRFSARLTDSPACLVVSENDLGMNFQKILKEAGQDVPNSQPILEINASHPVIERMDKEQDDSLFQEWSQVVFDQALLSEGSQLDDPAAFVQRLNGLLLKLSGEQSRIILPD